MKRLVPLILVACSTRSTPERAPALPAPAKVAGEHARTASHGAGIELIAISDDGGAVVTQDALDGTRLWPTLDGTREPFVVGVVPAMELALGRDADDFVIAARDVAGGAELVRVARDGGHVRSRARIAPDPALTAIAIAPDGVVALRADQTVAIFTFEGELAARLAAPPRTRLARLATRNGRTLVLFAHDDTTNGRWLAGTTWGATTPDFMLDPSEHASLSPSGKRLLIDFAFAAYVLDTETGAIVESFSDRQPIGFAAEDTVLYRDAARLVWQPLRAKPGNEHVEDIDASGPIAIANGLAVTATATGSLALHRRERVQYLGYAIRDVGVMNVVGNRVVVAATSSGQNAAALLDEGLVQRATLVLPKDMRTLGDLVPIDDHLALATHTFGQGSWWVMSLVDLDRTQTTQAFQQALGRREIRYEPATGLLEISDGKTSYLVAWDPERRSFETWYALAGGVADVHLVDPARTEGLVAIALRTTKEGKLEIIEIARDQLKVGAAIPPLRHYFVSGRAVDVDKVGNVYVADGGTYVVYRHGAEVMRFADVRTTWLVAHPAGTHIAVAGDQMLWLYSASGALEWQVAAPLAQQIAWLGDDLVVDQAGGIGKIDAATGALINRACGWSFGLGALPGNDVLPGESICDAQ